MSQVLDRLLQTYGRRPTGVIHVGANTGQEVPAYVDHGIAQAALIEPLEEPFRGLTSRLDGLPGYHAIQACCSDMAGATVTFHVASNGGQSSSFLAPRDHVQLYPRITFDSTIELITTTLDDVIDRLVRSTSIRREGFDYLAIDTQGAELHVLRGANAVLEHVDYAWLEVSFGGLYDGDPTIYDVIAYMRAAQFDLYHLDIGRKRWGDALFIRRSTMAGAA